LLVYVRTSQASTSPRIRFLTWADRQGRKTNLPFEPKDFTLPRLSPTGDRIVALMGPSRDVWSFDLRRGTSTRLTSDRIIAYSAPAWSPDGSRVIFTTWFDGEVGLGWASPDGSGPVEELIKGVGMRSFERTHPVMLPDGSGLIMTGLAPEATVEDLVLVPLAGERRVQTLFQAPGVERNPAIAPSGRFIAYDSDESGATEVYVRPFPNVGSRKWRISTEGGEGPRWTRAGSEIVYVDGHGVMVAVEVLNDRNGQFDYSKPKELFKVVRGENRGLDRGWDVTADGQRFLNVPGSVAEGTRTTAEMILIQNWNEELKRLVPRQPQ
jgi:Tol biopolymer transport system component